MDSSLEFRERSGDAMAHVPKPIDPLFRDRDHGYEGVKADWNTRSSHLSEFGLVIFHDTISDLRPNSECRRADMDAPRFVDELHAQGFAVLTINCDHGVSIVQPSPGGISLRPVDPAGATL
jgi:hypothetical protein